MRYIFISCLLITFYSCNEKKYSKKQIGDYWVEANFIMDSIIDGEAKTYDIKGKLVSIINYSRGVKNGVYLNFHSNGKIYDSINFLNGLENGLHYVYDSSGKIGYIDFYLSGHQLGPEIFYKHGIISAFYFISFEKFEIFNALYDVFGILSTQKGHFINASIYQTNLNDTPAKGIFSYFIYPPTLNISYELISRDSLTEKEIIIRQFTNQVFIDTVIEKEKNNSIYCIKGILKDSLNKEKKYFTKN